MTTIIIPMPISIHAIRRRSFRFSLRWLFIVVFLAACGFGCVLEKARQQGIALATLKKVGFQFYCDPYRAPSTFLERLRISLGEDEPRSVIALNLGDNERVSDEALIPIRELNDLEYLTIHGKAVTSTGLGYIRGLTQLKILDLRNTSVDDAGLVHLKGLAQIEGLDLGETCVTDAGLNLLGVLPRLSSLSLDGTQVTDIGIEQLKHFTQLTNLNLCDTKITDVGLGHILALKRLRNLAICRTQVTSAEARSLRWTLPNCAVQHDYAMGLW